MMGGARWSRNRNFHSRLWRDVNSLFFAPLMEISRISFGFWMRVVPTKMYLHANVGHQRIFRIGPVANMQKKTALLGIHFLDGLQFGLIRFVDGLVLHLDSCAPQSER